MLTLFQVLTPSLAFTGYVCFYQLLGGAHLESVLTNTGAVKKLLKAHQVWIVHWKLGLTIQEVNESWNIFYTFKANFRVVWSKIVIKVSLLQCGTSPISFYFLLATIEKKVVSWFCAFVRVKLRKDIVEIIPWDFDWGNKR